MKLHLLAIFSILVEESAIPLHEETYALAKHLQTKPVDYALYGGEDFQLVFTAPKSLVPKLEKSSRYYIDWRGCNWTSKG